MNEEYNILIEHYNVIKRAGKMIYGEDLMKKSMLALRDEN